MLAWFAFLACSLIWGSTWLAHKWALEDFTPVGLGSVRFLIAGVLCVAIAALRGETFARREHWKALLLAGFVMAGLANMLTAWSLLYIPSGVGAVLQAPIPVWLALMTLRQEPLSRAGWLAVFLGFFGVALVMWPSETGPIDPIAACVCALTAGAWSWASLYQRANVQSGGLFANAGLQMLVSGAIGCALTPLFGGFTQHGEVGIAAIAATAYLIVGGSCIAFASYLYLTRVWHPARAGSFAYVNPLVAVLIGWWLGGEAVTTTLAVGMAIIFAAVAVLQYAARQPA
jgi:drug/metabolite transporter (DMT)-like permease